ncbi:MAG TPA: hypothetical protein VN903_14210 [Polyangia bacterium]|nr:hypothetical protein [Polyangia bacterium]
MNELIAMALFVGGVGIGTYLGWFVMSKKIRPLLDHIRNLEAANLTLATASEDAVKQVLSGRRTPRITDDVFDLTQPNAKWFDVAGRGRVYATTFPVETDGKLSLVGRLAIVDGRLFEIRGIDAYATTRHRVGESAGFLLVPARINRVPIAKKRVRR